MPKADTDLANAIVAALKSLDTDGDLREGADDWGVDQGAIHDFAVNPRSDPERLTESA